MTTKNKERALCAALLLGLTPAACHNTALVGAEPPKADAALGGATGGVAPANGNGGVAGIDGSIVAAPDAAEAMPPAAVFAGDTNSTGTPKPGPWLFFDSMRNLNRDIYAILADGTSLTRMTTSIDTEREPAVSPDGTTLAFSADSDGTFQLYVVPLPAGAVRQLTHHQGGAVTPAWSPDGKQVAFSSGMSLFVIGSDGQNERAVVSGADRYAWHAVFAPGGHALVFDLQGGIDELDLVTGIATPIVRHWTATIEHPSLSPDGRSIAFNVSCDDDHGVLTIWVAPFVAGNSHCVDGTRVTFARDGATAAPSFSPDGLIAFERGKGAARIGIVSPGAPVRDVTHGEGDDRNPTWSPASLFLR
jgi:hypothetical protein